MPKRILHLNKYPLYFSLIIWRILMPIYLRSKAIDFKKNITCHGFPIIFKKEGSVISIGNNVVLCSTSKLTALGVYHAVILRTLSKDAILIIGDDTGISGATICAAKKVSIGKGVLLGANVTIMDTDFHSILPENRRNIQVHQLENKEVIIEDNVFIGANSIILKGSHIGKNSVIGAGSVVTGKISENSIAAGNPAKVLKQLK